MTSNHTHRATTESPLTPPPSSSHPLPATASCRGGRRVDDDARRPVVVPRKRRPAPSTMTMAPSSRANITILLIFLLVVVFVLDLLDLPPLASCTMFRSSSLRRHVVVAAAAISPGRVQSLTIRRVIKGASPSIVYDSCLCGWRDANFHLPIPPPLTLHRGRELSGYGFRLMRVPPFLIERCSDATYPYEMIYGVENPGHFTYQVKRHIGRITFEEGGEGKEKGIDTIFTWHVEWEPLRGCDWFVSPLTRWVVTRAADFTIAESERRRDGTSRYVSSGGKA